LSNEAETGRSAPDDRELLGTFRSILEGLDALVLVLDRDGRLSEPVQRTRVGEMLAPPESFLGRRLDETVLPPDIARRGAQALAALEAGAPPQTVEYWLDDLPGGARRFRARLTRRLDAEGQPCGFLAIIRDTTRAAQSEEELLRFKWGIEKSSDAVFITDPDGTIRYVNRAFEQVYGFAAHEALGRTPRILKSGLLSPENYAAFWRTLLSGKTAAGVIRNRRKDGTIIPVEGSNNAILDGDGAIVGFLGIHRDVSERERADEALRLTQFTIDRASQAIFWLESDGRIAYLNDAAAALVGAPKERLLGARPADLDPAITPEVWNRFWPRLRAEGSVSGDAEVSTTDGRRRWISTISNHIAWGGHELDVLFVRDITARRDAERALQESEERYRRLVDLLPDAVVVHQDGRFVFVNAAATRLLGASAPEQLIGRPVLDFVAPEFHAPVTDRIRRQAHGLGPVPAMEETFLTLQGERVDAEVTASGFLHGGRPAMLVVARDIRERRRAEAERARLAERLERTARMDLLGQLAGGMAHDFNNILSVVLGNAEALLAEVPQGTGWRADVEEIRQAAMRAASLTRQLLAFGRAMPVQAVRLDPNEVLGGLSKMLGRLVPENVAVEWKLAPTRAVVMDPAQLEQVIMNLVLNARDAMPGGGRLVVSTGDCTLAADAPVTPAVANPGAFVRLSVADTGTGMTPETLQRVFEPFFTTKPPGRGTGLGLSVVYGILQQNGAHVGVESTPGAGSVFHVYLPADAQDADRRAADSAEMPAGGGETILLVEDDDGVRRSLSRLLRRHGYVVLEAASAAEALETLEKQGQSVSLVLTDIVMPGMSGVELGRLVRERFPGVESLYSSGYFDGPGIPEGEDFVAKPAQPEELLRKVRRRVDMARKRRTKAQ